MTFWICRSMIHIAGLLTPKQLRAAWAEHWIAEIWHARSKPQRELLRFSIGAFADAADLRKTEPVVKNPSICIAVLAISTIVLFLGTGLFANGRQTAHLPEQVMLVALSMHVLGMDAPPSSSDLRAWQNKVQGVELAGFQVNGHVLKVTAGFERVFGYTPQTPFSFLGNRIDLIERLGSQPQPARIGVIARLDGSATVFLVERQLSRISPRNGCTVAMTSLGQRMRDPLATAAAVFGVMLLASGFLARGSLTFFFAKTVLLEFLVTAGWEEFATTVPIPSTGGTGLAFLLLYPVLVASAALALWWSLADQQGRCPVCACDLALPVRIGSRSSILLDRAAIEVLCPHGHGSLLVRTPERALWTPFDESWRLNP